MKAELGLNLQQIQKLIMTPELKQAIEILQLNSIDLNDLIIDEAEKNPILELVDDDKENVLDAYLSSYNKEDRYSVSYNKDDEEKDELDFDNIISNDTSLIDHLTFQLHITPVSKKIKEICKIIIYCLDSNGYLKESIEDICELYSINCDDAKKALDIIQSFDPAGVGARDLKECLKLQLISQNKYKSILKELVDNYLNDIADNKLNYLAKKLNKDIREIQNAIDTIKKLNPKPGANFVSYNDVKYVLPDAAIKKINGDYIVIINDTLYPTIKINNLYETILKNTDDENIKRYLGQKLQSALWLIKSIESRRDTLYKVIKAIIELQDEFFNKGPKYIKAMNLKQIADIVGVHESTVSRAINGKYVDTPFGTFELKYFFQNGIINNDGEKFSSRSIKDYIKQFIEKEDVKKPLSDSKITEMLKRKNIDISRRTVAKYREELNIPPSSKRKRY